MFPDLSYLYVPELHVGGVASGAVRKNIAEAVGPSEAGALASGSGPRITFWMYFTAPCLRMASTACSGRDVMVRQLRHAVFGRFQNDDVVVLARRPTLREEGRGVAQDKGCRES